MQCNFHIVFLNIGQGVTIMILRGKVLIRFIIRKLFICIVPV